MTRTLYAPFSSHSHLICYYLHLCSPVFTATQFRYTFYRLEHHTLIQSSSQWMRTTHPWISFCKHISSFFQHHYGRFQSNSRQSSTITLNWLSALEKGLFTWFRFFFDSIETNEKVLEWERVFKTLFYPFWDHSRSQFCISKWCEISLFTNLNILILVCRFKTQGGEQKLRNW